jgi:hypothetical protein
LAEEETMQKRHLQKITLSLAMTVSLAGIAQAQPAGAGKKFQIVEATYSQSDKIKTAHRNPTRQHVSRPVQGLQRNLRK